MAESVQDQAARDDAHLQSLGIKPELRRTLGFLSNFAIAFSFISVSTGTVRQLRHRPRARPGRRSSGRGRSSSSASSIVALVFAELASHFPVAGSIYQWSKRLSNRTLGWFTGWFYFWAQVVTVTAVAVIVAFVIDGIHGRESGRPDRVPRLAGPDRPDDDVHLHLADGRCVITTLINAYGVRLLSILNNIGVGTEILGHGRVRADPAVLREQPVARRSCSTRRARRRQTGGQYLPAFALGMFMALFVVYGFDTAGTFGEETVDASRQAPRGVLWSVIISGIVGDDLPARGHPRDPGHVRGVAEDPGGFPIATRSRRR